MLTAIECSTGISRRDYCSDSSISICSIPQLSVLLPLFPRNFPLQGKCSSPAVCPAREQLTQCRSHSLQSLSLIKNLVDISRKYCSLWKCFPFSPHSYINHLGLVLVMLGCLFSWFVLKATSQASFHPVIFLIMLVFSNYHKRHWIVDPNASLDINFVTI